MMPLSTRSLILLISLPVTFCAALVYYLYKTDDDWDEGVVSSNAGQYIEMKIPADRVASVVGRAGKNIKSIEEETNTTISFIDNIEIGDNKKFRTCKIRGLFENIIMAKAILTGLINNPPVILEYEMWVPERSCSRLIGRNGENIKAISSQSNAHIIIESSSKRVRAMDLEGNTYKRRVIIKGTTQEIAVAKYLLDEAVILDRNVRLTLNKRPPRIQPSANSTRLKFEEGKPSESVPSPIPTLAQPEAEQLASSAVEGAATDGMIQVYVSSVAHPYTFWVQLVSHRSVELDHLVENMTEFYSKEENQHFYKLQSVKPGQIVAAPFETDKRWYRVEVTNIVDGKKSDDGSPILNIFYVDYGDSGHLSLNQVLELRTDFLSLRFQAIECRLANIDMNEGKTEWSEEVICEFEQLVYSAQWKRIMVRICGYHQKDNDPNTNNPPIPVVSLFDPATGSDVAKELITKGLARRPLLYNSSLNLVKPVIIDDSAFKPKPL